MVEEEDAQYVTAYRSVVGAAAYLAAATRPDIAFAVNALSRHCSAPQKHHWAFVLYLLKFLNKSQGQGLRVNPTDRLLRVYADADFASDNETARSTTGVWVTFGHAPVAWYSKKQSLVTWSTAEAEYVALGDGVRMGQYIYRIFVAMGYWLPAPILYCDSAAAIAIANTHVDTKQSRHIKVRFHYIRDVVQSGEFQLSKIGTAENQADIMTKALNMEKFRKLTSHWLAKAEEEC